MPTTSNFGWTTPADTDLVKDGAAAIRTLGNGIDTSFLDLKGGTTGQVLSKASNTDLDFTWTAGGDITEVQAGTGISVASGTGPIPVVTNSMATEITASGDIIVGTGSGTFDNLPIGTTGQVLTADTTVSPYKVKWAAAAAGGLPNSTSFTATPTGFATPGALVTRYVESGDSVFYYGRIDFSASTTYSGDFTLDLPVTASMSGGARFQGLGECFISDFSSGIDYSGYPFIPTSTTLIFGIPKTNSTYLSDIPTVANGTPISFGNNDQLYFYIWYRKA